MKVFVQPGKTLQITNGGTALTSGQTVKLGNLIVVATGDIAANAVGEVLTEGVVTIVSDTGTAWSQGDPVYWDDSGKTWTKTGLANTPGGIAAAAKASGAASASVKLMPVSFGQAANVAATAAAAAATAGGSGPTASQVDTGIATAVAPLVVSINAILTSLKAKGIMLPA